MSTYDLMVRYINYACYELNLNNGKTIVFDPCICVNDAFHSDQMSKDETDYERSKFLGCDYILISHTHNDHIADAGYFANRYNSSVYVGSISARSLAEYQNINLRQIHACENSGQYETEDCSLIAIKGKHSLQRSEGTIEEIYNESTSKAFLETRINGSIEYVNYFICTKYNLRILFCGGFSVENYFADLDEYIKKIRPNILFCQVSRKMKPIDYAKSIALVGAPIVFPTHQDGINVETVGYSVSDWANEVNAALAKEGNCHLILPSKDERVVIKTDITRMDL